MLSFPPDIRSATAIVLPVRHIFLLSHMRAYSSLFGHIMGSNPAICGYYEMHIGYYSWKSLIRQKMLYFKDEEVKPGFSYMFDKVLHSDHSVSLKVLNSRRARTILCLRRPQDTIASILKLYNGIDPEHEFNSEVFATNYYIQRLNELEAITRDLERDFFYLDAEAIKSNSSHCLSSLSDWLALSTPLSPTYTLQKKTARERYGDSSEKIGSGKISKDETEHTGFNYNIEHMSTAVSTYERVRKMIIGRCSHHSLANSREC